MRILALVPQADRQWHEGGTAAVVQALVIPKVGDQLEPTTHSVGGTEPDYKAQAHPTHRHGGRRGRRAAFEIRVKEACAQ